MGISEIAASALRIKNSFNLAQDIDQLRWIRSLHTFIAILHDVFVMRVSDDLRMVRGIIVTKDERTICCLIVVDIVGLNEHQSVLSKLFI